MSAVSRDFLLDPEQRLTEQERALMTAMLADLLHGIVGEICGELPSGTVPVNDVDAHLLQRRLASAGLLDVDGLIELLLRRADEERIGSVARARSGTAGAALQSLIADGDPRISQTAMALILAKGRRRDRLAQPRVEINDLPQAVARKLTYRVAAYLRSDMPASLLGADADKQFESAAKAVLGRHDAARSLDASVGDLVDALAAADRLSDALLVILGEEGEVSLLVDSLARRTGLAAAAVWERLIDGREGRFAMLLRLASMERNSAARLLASLGDLIGVPDAGRAILQFEQIEEKRVAEIREWLMLDLEYRNTRRVLEPRHG